MFLPALGPFQGRRCWQLHVKLVAQEIAQFSFLFSFVAHQGACFFLLSRKIPRKLDLASIDAGCFERHAKKLVLQQYRLQISLHCNWCYPHVSTNLPSHAGLDIWILFLLERFHQIKTLAAFLKCASVARTEPGYGWNLDSKLFGFLRRTSDPLYHHAT